MKKYLVSSATLPLALKKAFYEYQYLPEALKMLPVDGMELVFLPEWDHYPLKTPTSADLSRVEKISLEKLIDFIEVHKLEVYSVHINRDVGCYLCGNSEEVKIGKEILARNLEAACRLNAEIAVFHLWDTYKEDLNIGNIFAEIASLISRYPLKIAYENVPISAKNLTQFEAWKI